MDANDLGRDYLGWQTLEPDECNEAISQIMAHILLDYIKTYNLIPQTNIREYVSSTMPTEINDYALEDEDYNKFDNKYRVHYNKLQSLIRKNKELRFRHGIREDGPITHTQNTRHKGTIISQSNAQAVGKLVSFPLYDALQTKYLWGY